MARQIVANPDDDSSVIAVVGPWGAGKTSVVNMVREALEDQATEFNILEFNPWLFSGVEQLAGRFFAELAAELRSKGEAKLSAIADRMGEYGERLRPLTELPIISDLPVVGDALRGAMKATAGAGGLLVRLDRFGKDSIASQRDAIDAALREQDKRFLIVIDDIDRLRDHEVLEVVRLVRLVADFPKTTYLLAFDRLRVEEVLGGGDRKRGRDYLEKIVQEVHDLPPAGQEDLTAFFTQAVDDAVGRLETGPFDPEYWANVFHLAVRPVVETPRDASRVARALPATIRTIGSEVNLVDVIALETYRVLAPEAYERIPDVSDLLTHTDSGLVGYGGRGEIDDGKKRLGELLSADTAHREAATELCRWVFPGSRTYIDNHTYTSEQLGRWRRDRRVAHPDVLRTYLSRVLPAGQVEADAVELAFRGLRNHLELREFFSELNAAEVEQVLERLVDYQDEFPVPDSAVIACLYELLPDMRQGRTNMFDFGPDLHVDRVALRLLRKLDDPAARATVVEEAVSLIPSLTGQLRLVRLVGHEANVGTEMVVPADGERLAVDLRERIRATPAGGLSAERDPLVLLGWVAKDGSGDDRASVASLLRSDQLLLAVLRSSLAEGFESQIGTVTQKRVSDIPWTWLRTLAADDDFDERVRVLAADQSPDSDERTLESLRVAMEYVNGVRQPQAPDPEAIDSGDGGAHAPPAPIASIPVRDSEESAQEHGETRSSPRSLAAPEDPEQKPSAG